jgi:hypothetical protein
LYVRDSYLRYHKGYRGATGRSPLISADLCRRFRTRISLYRACGRESGIVHRGGRGVLHGRVSLINSPRAPVVVLLFNRLHFRAPHTGLHPLASRIPNSATPPSCLDRVSNRNGKSDTPTQRSCLAPCRFRGWGRCSFQQHQDVEARFVGRKQYSPGDWRDGFLATSEASIAICLIFGSAAQICSYRHSDSHDHSIVLPPIPPRRLDPPLPPH